jgi:uncharacterized membrane protein YphA (DoxX/SURF4 family)
LLLLRLAVGTTLLAEAVPRLADVRDPEPGAIAFRLLGLAIGASLIIGFGTRIAAVMAALLVAIATLLSMSTSAFGLLRSHSFDLNMTVVAIAIACLGPGAFSLDAALFGRRKVIIPRSSLSSH